VKMNAAALARLDRNRRALRLRTQGMPWPEIARECGFNSGTAAIVAVGRLLRKETAASVELSRALYRERVEMLMRALWLAAIHPGLARKAASEAAQPEPPSQEKAIELLRRLLDDLSNIEGTKAPVRLAGSAGGPIEGRLDVIHWKPNSEFMTAYVQVLKDAGLVDELTEGVAQLVIEA
jgi:transcriptional regulator GlxA family with amidase domain